MTTADVFAWVAQVYTDAIAPVFSTYQLHIIIPALLLFVIGWIAARWLFGGDK